jgi:cytochrome o ubiquinol oxidase operon protein cyoD
MIDPHHGWNASLKPQCIGFVISFVLVVSVYRIVTHHHLSDGLLYATVYISALAQALAQLVFFMHLGLESKPRWNTITFLFTLLVIVLVIGGSIWIMNNLDYNLMPNMVHE